MQAGRRTTTSNSSPTPAAIPITVEVSSYYFPFYFRDEGRRDAQWTPGGSTICLAEIRLHVPGMTYPIMLKDLQVRESTVPNEEGLLRAYQPSKRERNAYTGDEEWVRAVELPKVLNDAINGAINEGPQALTDTLLSSVQQAWYEDCSTHYPESAEKYADAGFPGWLSPEEATGRLISSAGAVVAPAAPAPAPVARPAAPVARPAAPQPQAQAPARQAPAAPAIPPRPAPRKPAAIPIEDDDLTDPFAE